MTCLEKLVKLWLDKHVASPEPMVASDLITVNGDDIVLCATPQYKIRSATPRIIMPQETEEATH
jgi:hypothetical protein